MPMVSTVAEATSRPRWPGVGGACGGHVRPPSYRGFLSGREKDLTNESSPRGHMNARRITLERVAWERRGPAFLRRITACR